MQCVQKKERERERERARERERERKANPVMQIIKGGVYNHEFDLHDADEVIISVKIHMSVNMTNKCKLLINAKYHCTNYLVHTTKPTLFCAHYFICTHKWLIFSFLCGL
jgi:hypothetical protein